MALRSVKGSENIPEGAVRVTENKALTYQKNLIRDWEDDKDVFFLRNGKFISTVVTFTSASLISQLFRRSFGLQKAHIIAVPISLVSPLFTWMKFDIVVTNKILLMKPECPVCWHSKVAALYTINSAVYPMLLAATGCSGVAQGQQLLEFPNLFRQPKEYFKLCFTLLKPSGLLKLQVITAVCLFTSLAIPYLQWQELITVQNKLVEMRKTEEFDSELVIN